MAELILPQNAPLSMSSKEIAELTGKAHPHVLRDIRAMLAQIYDIPDDPSLDYLDIHGVSVERDPHTKRQSRIDLDKDHTLTLLTGYDAKARLRVMRRWQELESRPAIDLAAPMAAMMAAITDLTSTVNANLAAHGMAIRGIQSRVDAVEHKVDAGFNQVNSRFDDMETRLARRANFSEYACRLFRLVAHRFYAGRCPCCQETPILGQHGEPLPDVLRYDHWNGKQHNMISNGWAVCVACNRALERHRHERHLAFQLFHQHLNRLQASGAQLELPFDRRRSAAA